MSIVPSFLPASDKINGAINSFFGPDSIDVLRNVSWDKKYLWTVDFIDAQPPAPFDKFFPASDVTIPMAILETDTIPFGQDEIQIPIKTRSKELSITFYDDEKRTLLNYMKDWIDIDILNGGRYVSGLKDHHPTEVARTVSVTGSKNNVKPVRSIELKLLDSYKKTVQSWKFGIFPTGQIDFNGDQGSEATTYSMTFIVIANESAKDENSTSFSDIGVDLLGRFI